MLLAVLALAVSLVYKSDPKEISENVVEIGENRKDKAPEKRSKNVEDTAKKSKKAAPRPEKGEKTPISSGLDKKSKPQRDSDAVRMTPEGETRTARVMGVIDGDTLRVFGGEKIRLIGINTPEKNEEFCPQATDLLKRLVEGKDVTLAFDVEKKDRYGRSLAFIYADGVFVNAEIVRQGLALFYEFKPNVHYSKLFLKLQREARAAKRGLWVKTHKPESEYYSSRRSARFHRPDCRKRSRKSKTRFSSRNAALDTGRSPCPDCRP